MINDKINMCGQPYSLHSGSWSNIEQVFMCHYPFLTSTGGRTDVGATNMGAYYYQGFCKTPNGFAMVRLAPDSGKVNSGDVSQIIEINDDGSFRRMAGPTTTLNNETIGLGHGNGMCYYDNNLYIDIGSYVAIVNYSDLTITSLISMYGGCPAIDRENGLIYSAACSGSSRTLYTYNISSGNVTSISIQADCPEIYNGSFYKNGVFYGITYNNDFVMIDVKTGAFLGGISTSSIDTTGIYLYELEDADCAEDGTVYIMSQQPLFTTRVYTTAGVQ